MGIATASGFRAAFRPSYEPTPGGIAIYRPAAPKQAEQLEFCRPINVANNPVQYIPVGAVVSKDPRATPVLHAYLQARVMVEASILEACLAAGEDESRRISNDAILDRASGVQHLLLPKLGVVGNVAIPSDKCKSGDGNVPCDSVVWSIYAADTDRDGIIDERDALVLYASTISGENLRALTPSDATVLGYSWIKNTNLIDILILRDTNRDGKYSEENGNELIEVDVATGRTSSPLQPEIFQQLRKALP